VNDRNVNDRPVIFDGQWLCRSTRLVGDPEGSQKEVADGAGIRIVPVRRVVLRWVLPVSRISKVPD